MNNEPMNQFNFKNIVGVGVEEVGFTSVFPLNPAISKYSWKS